MAPQGLQNERTASLKQTQRELQQQQLQLQQQQQHAPRIMCPTEAVVTVVKRCTPPVGAGTTGTGSTTTLPRNGPTQR
jgi:hypothetical protein